MVLFKKKSKIFCIGRNKTGTTSLGQALADFGMKLGDQSRAELLIKDYAKANWKPILAYCNSADAFQDVPFSCPYTWLILHHHFPESKFILTTRDENIWYNSITTFHAKLFSKDGQTAPSAEELKAATYRYQGYMWDENRAVWNTPENDIYNKKLLIEQYHLHNESVRNFFRNKPNFIELDLSRNDSYPSLCAFLNQHPLYESFPHLNKSGDIRDKTS